MPNIENVFNVFSRKVDHFTFTMEKSLDRRGKEYFELELKVPSLNAREVRVTTGCPTAAISDMTNTILKKAATVKLTPIQKLYIIP